jgi:hypothetical protein
MAIRDEGWITLAANSSTSWFIHGYGATEAVTYSIVVFPGTGAGVPFPGAHATLTQGESFKWVEVDGTFAYKVYITNLEPFNSIDVHLLSSVQSL